MKTAPYYNIGFVFNRLSEIVKEFSKTFDVKYVVAGSVDDLCRYVREAALFLKESQSEKLMNVVIIAQGNHEHLAISEPGTQAGTLNAQTNFARCFKGLDPAGRIVLISSKTGAPPDSDPKNCIAQKMANLARREVVAATGVVYGNRLTTSTYDQLQIFHPSENSNSNLFKLFRPIYDKCKQVFWDKIHPREKIAVESIKANLVNKGLISASAGLEELQDYLRFCPEDPKKKLLFLSGEGIIMGP